MKMKRVLSLFIVFVMVMLILPVQVEASGAPVIKSITLNKKNITIAAGESVKLKVTLNPQTHIKVDLRWKIINNKNSDGQLIAGVDSTGRVTGANPGTATVIAYIGKVQVKCKVTVLSSNITVDLDGIKFSCSRYVRTMAGGGYAVMRASKLEVEYKETIEDGSKIYSVLVEGQTTIPKDERDRYQPTTEFWLREPKFAKPTGDYFPSRPVGKFKESFDIRVRDIAEYVHIVLWPGMKEIPDKW